MQTIAREHAVFRTQLLPLARAERFARCLQANGQYTAVELVESRRSRDPAVRFFVRYRPTDPDRAARLLARRQQERTERASEEGSEYVWLEDPDARPGREFFHCQTLGGHVYEVDAGGRECSCPDHQFRCKPAGLRCKHLIAFDLGLGTMIRRHQLPTIPRQRAA